MGVTCYTFVIHFFYCLYPYSLKNFNTLVKIELLLVWHYLHCIIYSMCVHYYHIVLIFVGKGGDMIKALQVCI